MVHLFFLKTFVSVARSGSFRTAASENNVTQPAVSQHIRLLEKRLNCKLFDRSTKTAALTSAGEIFLNYAQQILEIYQKAENEIGELSEESTGSIRIASIYSMGLYLLKPVMQHFMKKYPGINIQLEYRQNERIYEMVRTNVADFGLIALPQERAGIAVKIFARDRLTLVQSRKRPFFKKSRVPLKALNGVKLVAWDPHTPTGRLIVEFLRGHNINPEIIKESDNIETIKNGVEIGMGCSILPESTVQFELKSKLFDKIGVEGMEIDRPLAVIHNENRVFNRQSRLFYNMITSRTTHAT